MRWDLGEVPAAGFAEWGQRPAAQVALSASIRDGPSARCVAQRVAIAGLDAVMPRPADHSFPGAIVYSNAKLASTISDWPFASCSCSSTTCTQPCQHTNHQPVIEGPVCVVAPVHAKVRRGGYAKNAAGDRIDEPEELRTKLGIVIRELG